MPDPRLLIVVPGPGLVAVSVTAFPTVALAPGPTVAEGDPAPFTITLSAATAVEVCVDYETADDSAVAGTDYEAVSGTVLIPAGETTRTVTVATMPGAAEQPARTFALLLSAAHATLGEATGALVITTDAALATIQADPVTPPVVPSGEGPHDFFDAWVASVHHHTSNPLRSEADLLRAGGKTVGEQWRYDPARDAAHLFRSNYENNPAWGSWNAMQLFFSVNTPSLLKDRVLLIWDECFPEVFRTGCGGLDGVSAYKAMQIMLQGDKGWWTLMHLPGTAWNPANAMPPEVGYTVIDEFRMPGRGDPNSPYMPAGLKDGEPIVPSGPGTVDQAPANRAARLPHSVWVRQWVEVVHFQPPEAFTDWNTAYGVTVQPNPSPLSKGCWHMVSHWMASETSDPVRIAYRVPVWMAEEWADAPYVARMRFEMNSSKHGATAPLQAWGRNLLALKNLVADDTDTRLFRKPVP